MACIHALTNCLQAYEKGYKRMKGQHNFVHRSRYNSHTKIIYAQMLPAKIIWLCDTPKFIKG